MLRSSLCDYSNAYILVRETITTDGLGADYTEQRTKEGNKGVTFKNCAPFTNCIGEVNNTQIVDEGKDLDVVMPMYNLIKYSDNYPKNSGSLWQCYTEMSQQLQH